MRQLLVGWWGVRERMASWRCLALVGCHSENCSSGSRRCLMRLVTTVDDNRAAAAWAVTEARRW